MRPSPAPRRALRLAASLGVAFEARENVSERAVGGGLNRASMMVYAPRLEPFGYAPLEANACALPVVAVAEGGVRETVVDGENGLVVEDEASMAHAVERLRDDPALAARPGAAGAGLVRSDGPGGPRPTAGGPPSRGDRHSRCRLTMPVPAVTVVILNWNNWRDTVECVESCRRATYPGLRLLVVDNGSTDGSESHVAIALPRTSIFSRPAATSGSPAATTPGSAARSPTARSSCSSSTTTRRWIRSSLTALVEAARTRPRAGMFCPKILLFDDPRVIWYAGASFHPWLGWGRHRGHGRRDRGQYDRIEETDRPTGCALMVRRSLCEEIGLLRDDYFCYAEDLEWGLRARAPGTRSSTSLARGSGTRSGVRRGGRAPRSRCGTRPGT